MRWNPPPLAGGGERRCDVIHRIRHQKSRPIREAVARHTVETRRNLGQLYAEVPHAAGVTSPAARSALMNPQEPFVWVLIGPRVRASRERRGTA